MWLSQPNTKGVKAIRDVIRKKRDYVGKMWDYVGLTQTHFLMSTYQVIFGMPK